MKCGFVVHAVLASAVLVLTLTPAAAQDREAPEGRGERTFKSQGCYGCHLVGKFGTPIGPDLSHVGAKYPLAYLARWLDDPQTVRPTAHMPKLELSREEIQALAAYLASLK